MKLENNIIFHENIKFMLINKKQVHKQNQVKQIHRGPISKDKSGNIVLQIKAKPGAKNNHITGTFIIYLSLFISHYYILYLNKNSIHFLIF